MRGDRHLVGTPVEDEVRQEAEPLRVAGLEVFDGIRGREVSRLDLQGDLEALVALPRVHHAGLAVIVGEFGEEERDMDGFDADIGSGRKTVPPFDLVRPPRSPDDVK